MTPLSFWRSFLVDLTSRKPLGRRVVKTFLGLQLFRRVLFFLFEAMDSLCSEALVGGNCFIGDDRFEQRADLLDSLPFKMQEPT